MFLRKLSTLVITVMVVGALVALVGCSSEPSTDGSAVNNVNNTANNGSNDANSAATEADSSSGNSAPAAAFVAGSKMHITASGKDIYLNEPTSDFIDALGDPDSYFESESCAFQGLDKVYTYKNFVIRTYPIDEVDYVSSIEFRNDSIVTSTNCYLGMDADTVKANNGDYSVDTDSEAAIVYVDGDTKLSYIFTDGEVTSITYTRVE